MAELLRNHDLACPAYNTKDRDLEDEPCTCGARVPSARDTAIREAAKLAGALAALDDFVAMTFSEFAHPHSTGTALAKKVREILRAKYTATPATETQPAQDGERR